MKGTEGLGGTEWPSSPFAGPINVEVAEGHGGTNWLGGSVVVSNNVVEGNEGPRGSEWPGG